MDEEKTAEAGSRSWVDDRLADIDSITNSLERVKELVKLSSELLPSAAAILEQALAAIQVIRKVSDKAVALCVIASCLSEPYQKQILQEALNFIPAIENEFDKVEVISTIAYYLPTSATDLLQQTLDTAQTIKDIFCYKTIALSEIAPYLPLQQALDTVQSIEDSFYKVTALSGMALR